MPLTEALKKLIDAIQGPGDMAKAIKGLAEECQKRGQETDGPFEPWFNAEEALAEAANIVEGA